jgi:tetratricopeptide (TPR) repeat protein
VQIKNKINICKNTFSIILIIYNYIFENKKLKNTHIDKVIYDSYSKNMDYFNNAKSCINNKNYGKAISCLNSALKNDPNNIQYIGYKGYALFNMKKSMEGINEFKRAVDMIEKISNVSKLSEDEIIDYIDFIRCLCEVYVCNENVQQEAKRLAILGINTFPNQFTSSLLKFTNISFAREDLGMQY